MRLPNKAATARGGRRKAACGIALGWKSGGAGVHGRGGRQQSMVVHRSGFALVRWFEAVTDGGWWLRTVMDGGVPGELGWRLERREGAGVPAV
ncbi:hypothetical protein U1Q18_013290 [Sarracenia purpurea var. burkii]